MAPADITVSIWRPLGELSFRPPVQPLRERARAQRGHHCTESLVSRFRELEPRGQLAAATGGHSSGSLTADDGPTDIP